MILGLFIKFVCKILTMNEYVFNFDEYFNRLRLERYYSEPLHQHRVDKKFFDIDLDILDDIRPIEYEREAATINTELMRSIMEMYTNANIEIVMDNGKKKSLMKERQKKLVSSI